MFKILHIYMCERFVYNYTPCIRPISIRLSNITKQKSKWKIMDIRYLYTLSLHERPQYKETKSVSTKKNQNVKNFTPIKSKRRKQKWIDIDLYVDIFSEVIETLQNQSCKNRFSWLLLINKAKNVST